MKLLIIYFIFLGILLLKTSGKAIQGEPQEVPPSSTIESYDNPPVSDATNENDKTSGPAVDIPATVMDSAVPEYTKCECAVFNTETPTATDQPIILQNPVNVTCNAEGEDRCLKLCSVLAKAAQDDGPKLLCSAIGHHNQLRASVHSRICSNKEWTYTGLTAPTDICCHNHQVVDCNSLAEISTPSNQMPY